MSPQADIRPHHYITKRSLSGKDQVKVWLKISERLCYAGEYTPPSGSSALWAVTRRWRGGVVPQRYIACAPGWERKATPRSFTTRAVKGSCGVLVNSEGEHPGWSS